MYFKDIKLYANRIEDLVREHIVRCCVELAAGKNDLKGLRETLQKIVTCLGVKPEFLVLEMNNRGRSVG